MLYESLKVMHVLGVVLLVGNVTITAFWKVMADRTREPKLMAHAVRSVIVADWLFTLPGITLLSLGGCGMVWMTGIDVLKTRWLANSLILFLSSGLIWIAILIPYQIRLARLARAPVELFRSGEFVRDSRAWLIWGIVATIPLVAAMVLMIFRWE